MKYLLFTLLFFTTLSFAIGDHYSYDGKRKFVGTYNFDKFGNVVLEYETKHLPAKTDGKIIDHPTTPKKKTITIPPSAKKMASRFGKGLNLALAVDLLFQGIDYVMDPTNNSVTIGVDGSYECSSYENMTFSSFDDLTAHFCSSNNLTVRGTSVTQKDTRYEVYSSCSGPNGLVRGFSVCTKTEKETEVLTDEQIAERIIELAKQGNKAAQDIVIESVKQDVEDGEYDDILFEVTKDGVEPDTETDTDTDTKTDTDTETETETDKEKDKEKDWPDFCKWAKPVCDWFNWTKEPPPEPTDNQKPIDDITTPPNKDDRFKSYVNFNGQCPSRNFEVMILNHHIVKPIPYADFCRMLEMIAPWLVGFTFIGTGAFVVRNL